MVNSIYTALWSILNMNINAFLRTGLVCTMRYLQEKISSHAYILDEFLHHHIDN